MRNQTCVKCVWRRDGELNRIGTIAVDGRICVYSDDKPSNASQGGCYDWSWGDGLMLTEVPEPATLMLPAGGSLLSIRRRR
jgi:hypothetical protein